MTTLFTLTVNAGVSNQQGPSQNAERSFFAYCAGRAIQLAGTGNGQALNGNIVDENGVIVGTYAYSPVATQ